MTSIFSFCLIIIASITAAVAQQVPAATIGPQLGEGEFRQRLKDLYYEEDLPQIEEISIADAAEKELFLANLAHLPNLRRIGFDDVQIGPADFEFLKACPKLQHIEFAGYSAPDVSLLSTLKSLHGISFSRCTDVPWDSIATAAPLLSTLSIYKSELTDGKLEALTKLAELENLELSSISEVDDDDLGALGRCGNLKTLSIDNCPNVTGAFLAQLPALELKGFHFTGSMPAQHAKHLGRFSHLREIRLNIDQQLDEEWFAAVAANCKGIERLVLAYQCVEQSQIDKLSGLEHLKDLQIYYGSSLAGLTSATVSVPKDSGVFRCLSRLSGLRILKISGTYKLSAEDVDAITSLANLRELELRDVQCESGSFVNIARLKQLQSLGLHGSQGLDSADAAAIGKLSSLRHLDLSNITTEAADFSSLSGLSNLTELNVSDYRALTDQDLTFARGMASLEKLTLKNNSRLSDRALTELGRATKLKELSITKLPIGGSGFAEWPADHALESVFIEGCPISNVALKSLARLQNLESLEIRVIRLGSIEVDVSCLADAKSLKFASLLGSYVTSQESLDRLAQQRPDIEILCRATAD